MMKLKILEVAEEQGMAQDMAQGMVITIKVLKLLKSGKDNRAIANELGITEAEVDKILAMLKEEQLV